MGGIANILYNDKELAIIIKCKTEEAYNYFIEHITKDCKINYEIEYKK